MTNLRMTPVLYTGEVWRGQAVDPQLWALLNQKDLLVELTNGTAPFCVVLGIPHHASPGDDRIADDWLNPKTGKLGRTADESTGLNGLAVFSALRARGIACKLVIACHPTDHDPNKTPGSPYWEHVFSTPYPHLLLELHGAAHHRRHALELSAGQNSITYPDRFGAVLAYFYAGPETLAVQQRAGTKEARVYVQGKKAADNRLQNPALETTSLAYAGEIRIPALHLEMKGIFRRPDPGFASAPRPSAAGWKLANALADTLEILNRSDEVRISAAELGLPSRAMLVRPSLEYQDSFFQAVDETPLEEAMDNPDLIISTPNYLTLWIQQSRSLILDGMPENPPEEFLWLVDQGEFIGRAFFLHWLNEFRLKTDGQVDYWIRPSKRRMGYGKLLLRLLLERYRQLGQERILISCLTSNAPSRKIIESNGGIFESEIEIRSFSGQMNRHQRFWIDLKH